MEYHVRLVGDRDLTPALEMVRRIYLLDEVQQRSEETVRQFLCYTCPDNIMDEIRNDELAVWCCCTGIQTVGLIAVRNTGQVKLFFISEEHQDTEAAYLLYQKAFRYCAWQDEYQGIRVDTSSYLSESLWHLAFSFTGNLLCTHEPEQTIMKLASGK